MSIDKQPFFLPWGDLDAYLNSDSEEDEVFMTPRAMKEYEELRASRLSIVRGFSLAQGAAVLRERSLALNKSKSVAMSRNISVAPMPARQSMMPILGRSKSIFGNPMPIAIPREEHIRGIPVSVLHNSNEDPFHMSTTKLSRRTIQSEDIFPTYIDPTSKKKSVRTSADGQKFGPGSDGNLMDDDHTLFYERDDKDEDGGVIETVVQDSAQYEEEEETEEEDSMEFMRMHELAEIQEREEETASRLDAALDLIDQDQTDESDLVEDENQKRLREIHEESLARKRWLGLVPLEEEEPEEPAVKVLLAAQKKPKPEREKPSVVRKLAPPSVYLLFKVYF